MFDPKDFSFQVVATGLGYPEGPVYLPDGSLALVEVKNGNVKRLVEGEDGWKVTQTIALGGSPNGAALGEDGQLYVCNSGGFVFKEQQIPSKHGSYTLNIPMPGLPQGYAGGSLQKVDLQSGAVTVVCDSTSMLEEGQQLRGLDDLVFDASGGLWFTDYGKQTETQRDVTNVYYLPKGATKLNPVLKNRNSPNGIALSPKGDRLYVAETITRQITYWELDPNAPGTTIDNPMTPDYGYPFAPMPRFAQPDSMAVDEEGNVYVASMLPEGLQALIPGGISIFSPAGALLAYVPIAVDTPDPLPSNLCFGGADRKTAFITLGGTGQLVTCQMPIPGLRHNFAGGAK